MTTYYGAFIKDPDGNKTTLGTAVVEITA